MPSTAMAIQANQAVRRWNMGTGGGAPGWRAAMITYGADAGVRGPARASAQARWRRGLRGCGGSGKERGSDGARGRTRTGMTARSRDFRTTSAFAAGHGRSWSGARLHLGAVRYRCPPSALYTFLRRTGGLARRWLGPGSRAFAEFDGCHPRGFPRRAQIFKSLVSTDFT